MELILATKLGFVPCVRDPIARQLRQGRMLARGNRESEFQPFFSLDNATFELVFGLFEANTFHVAIKTKQQDNNGKS
jgi:hypothetical protein